MSEMSENAKDWLDRGLKIAGFAIVVGGLVWAFAKYPDRDEFNSTVQVQRERIELVKDELRRLQIDQAKTQTTIEAIKASADRQERTQEDIERKLDRALEGRGMGRRR